MADLKYDVGVSVTGALQSLDQLSKKIDNVGKDFEKISNTVSKFGAALGATLSGLIIATANFADEISDLADANETAISTVLGLSSALAAAGGNADSVGRMFQTFANNVESANSGNLKMLNTFARLGVSMKDLGTSSTDVLRNNVLKELAAIDDAATRNALAMDMFGKSMVGVDIKKLSKDLDEQIAKYQQYEGVINTAGAAFDAFAKILKDIKVAAAVAFEPLFSAVSKMKIDITDLAELVRLLIGAFAALTGASILGGLAKLTVALIGINNVVKQNKIIAIASLIGSVVGALGVWLGMTKDVNDSTEQVNTTIEETSEKTKEVIRDQTGLLDVINKQKESLAQVAEAYKMQMSNLREKLSFEQQNLQASETQKKIISEQFNIEQQTLQSLNSLKQKYDALDAQSRAARLGDYEKERDSIIAIGEETKKTAAKSIEWSENFKIRMADLTGSYKIVGDSVTDLMKKQVDLNSATTGVMGQIEMNQRLNDLVATRSLLLSQINNVSMQDRENTQVIIEKTISSVDALSMSHEQLVNKLREQFELSVKNGDISKETNNTIFKGIESQLGMISKVQGVMVSSQQSMEDTRRSFSYGWDKAFKEYADNAQNAASQAEQIFKKVTQSMEDMFVNFAKTGKFEWKGFLNSIVEDLLRSQIRQLLTSTFSLGGNAGTSMGGSVWGGLSSLLGFANGGMIPTNQPVLVGERGPEIITGAGGRTVIPNSQIGATPTYVTYNINAVDAPSFKAMIASDPSFIYAVSQQGSKGVPTRR